MTTTTHDAIDAEVISIDGTPYQEGATMTPHTDTMAAPELVAADVAILAVAQAVAKAATALADARTAIVEMEIALADYNARSGRCSCGCS